MIHRHGFRGMILFTSFTNLLRFLSSLQCPCKDLKQSVYDASIFVSGKGTKFLHLFFLFLFRKENKTQKTNVTTTNIAKPILDGSTARSLSGFKKQYSGEKSSSTSQMVPFALVGSYLKIPS